MANVFDVANFFIQAANENEDDQMTNLKLNKLLYFAQGAFLARTGTPLFSSDIQPWDLGPVVPDVYHRYKVCGRMPIQADETDFNCAAFREDELEVLLDVMREYGQYTGAKLVDLTHMPDTPWSKAKEANKDVISLEDIAAYFRLHPVSCLKDRINVPRVIAFPSDWYDPDEDAEWEGYL